MRNIVAIVEFAPNNTLVSDNYSVDKRNSDNVYPEQIYPAQELIGQIHSVGHLLGNRIQSPIDIHGDNGTAIAPPDPAIKQST